MAQDSQLPALISETPLEFGVGAPAVFSAFALPTDPSELEGWEAKETGDFLESMVPGLRLLERADSVRLAVGMGLWKLRQTTVEGDYGRKVSALAESAGVGVSSLRRWRQVAEDHYELGPPPKATARSVAAKDRETRRSAQDVSTVRPAGTIEAKAKQVPNAHLTGLEPDEPAGDPPTPPDPPTPTPRERAESTKDKNKAVRDLIDNLLATDVAVGAQAAKRSVLAEVEGWAKRAQQANTANGSRVVLLAADLVSRFPTVPSEPFDAGVNRAIRDLLAENERLRQPAPSQPTPASPAATKAKPAAATKKAPKPTTVKRPKKGEPCPHPREAHVGVDMRGVTCSWCDAKALTHVSLKRMGQAVVAAR